jgi:hypothetical protein
MLSGFNVLPQETYLKLIVYVIPAIKDCAGVIIHVFAALVRSYEYCIELVPPHTYEVPCFQLFPLPALILVHPVGGNVVPSKPSKKEKGKLVVAVALKGVAVAFKQ